MRNRYLVAYDIRDPIRLRDMRRTMMGFGEPLQYSVFLCELSSKEKVIMISTVSGVIQHSVDSILVIDLGPLGGRGNECIEFLGQPRELTERGPTVI